MSIVATIPAITLPDQFKYPRWIEFLPELPMTATNKIQRFILRERVVP